jgi:phosphoglycolate phosphatase
VFRANDRLIESSFLDIKPYTGVREMLAGLGSAGSKMALLTGSGANVKNLYEHHDIHNYFESVVHRERLTKQKPDPEGFYLAMKELGLAPDRSVMVGDSSNDMLAGRNAGAYRVVGVSYGGGTREELEKAGADYVVDSVAELSALLKAGDGPALEYCALRNTLPL